MVRRSLEKCDQEPSSFICFRVPVFLTLFLLISLPLGQVSSYLHLLDHWCDESCTICFILGIILLHLLTLSGTIFVELCSKVSDITGNLELLWNCLINN